MTIKKEWLIPLCISAVFTACMFMTISDYGLMVDSHKHLPRGEAYLHYILTGKTNYKEGKPADACIFVSRSADSFLEDSELISYGPTTDVFGAITCTIFYKKLKILKAVDAHHASVIIILALTVFPLYFLVLSISKSRFIAAFSVVFLLLYPRVIAHVHNNIKDIPVACYIIAALYLVWLADSRRKYLLLIPSSLLVGLAFGVKATALVIFPILGIWFLAKYYRRFSDISLQYWLFLVSYPVIAFSSSLLLRPDFWLDPRRVARIFFGAFYWKLFDRMQVTHAAAAGPLFDFKHIRHVIGCTPIPLFILFVIGFCIGLSKIKDDKNRGFLLFYLILLIPLAATIKGGTVLYGGIRHFILFAPGLCFFAAFGMQQAGVLLKKYGGGYLGSQPVLSLLVMAITGSLLYSIVSVHPFQALYHNMWVKQTMSEAEKSSPKTLTDAEDWLTDYWMISVRQAVRWLNKNARPNAALAIYPKNPYPLINNEELRDDLVILSTKLTKQADYVICVLRPECTQVDYKGKMELMQNHKAVKTIYSQGDPILIIYDLKK